MALKPADQFVDEFSITFYNTMSLKMPHFRQLCGQTVHQAYNEKLTVVNHSTATCFKYPHTNIFYLADTFNDIQRDIYIKLRSTKTIRQSRKKNFIE